MLNRHGSRSVSRPWLAVGVLGASGAATAANGPSVLSINVTAARPGVPGIGVAAGQLPFGVQTQSAATIRRQEPLNVRKFMADNLNGVTVNAAQNNPFQPDISFRGFTASPVLGTPQGLSVYMDGVRVNQPFGDVVNWDLIPQSAIETMSLVPGSNPIFGLNSLGGSLVITTKSGVDFPGTGSQGVRRLVRALRTGGRGRRQPRRRGLLRHCQSGQ
ncbi:MAG TPA: Plug domain-containing protein [Gammaproteobacteria bacterium]|nr:Plug domain-containing protein [Gammaproteobacteria bacterium]